jgi:SAM-dependent methyltransferase
LTVQQREIPPPEVAQPAPEDAYRLYFASGFYDRRYPMPNLAMWRRIESLLTPAMAVLDFGCGSGRYLMHLRGRAHRVIGYDVSPTALQTIHRKAAETGWHDLMVLGPGPEDLDAHIDAAGPVDLVLCLFGVVGHITDAPTRAEALQRMRRALKPGSGRLLISVPNRRRRFRAEQRIASGALVRYQRRTEDGGIVELGYQLFDPESLTRELADAGFRVRRIGCESILPESWLLHHALLRQLDGLLARVFPARWAYGIYAEATC